DNSNLNHLFLFHLSLEVQQGSGETLNDIVEAIFELIAEDFQLSSIFGLKLLQGGYYNDHKPLYENKGYHIRQETSYEVRDDFPRIQEGEVRNGVGDITYSIIISYCNSYQTNEQAVYNVLN